MKKVIAILVVLSITAFAGQVEINASPIPQEDADWLQYDDGTAKWVIASKYMGVWFDIQNFVPGETTAQVLQTQVWFYHHPSLPWDTSDVYIELWSGDSTAPTSQLDQTQVTATHYAPSFVTYTTPISCGQTFWAITNAAFSSTYWPSSLTDETLADPQHSLYSQDLIVWEPMTHGDLFIRVQANIPDPGALGGATWGSLKAAF